MFKHIFLLLTIHPGLVYASEPSVFRIDKIEVKGLTKTKPEVILTELNFAAGDLVSEDKIVEGITRIKNTNLFVNVRHELNNEAAGKGLTIFAEDRWTTIPIAKFSSGGGVTQTILGAYDPNIAGRYLEAGAQYERLGETNSGVAWFRNKRLLNSFFYLDVQAWSINRLRTRYLQGPQEPEVKAGFLQTRKKFYLGLIYEFCWWLRAGFSLESNSDSFSDRYVSEEVKSERLVSMLPPDTKFRFYAVHSELGRLDYNGYMVDGVNAVLDYRHGMSVKSDVNSFEQYDITINYFKTLAGNSTIAQRLKLGGTDTDSIQYWYYLGGLDSIRGFSDNRFAGRYIWLSNTEWRLAFYESTNLVVQSIAFYDAVGASEELENLDTAVGESAGLGFRFIAPKIYRLVARIDYARPLLRKDQRAISFGVQQFF